MPFHHTQPSTLSFFTRLLDYIPDAAGKPTASISLHDRTASDCANFFRGLLRSNIIFANVENYVLNKLKATGEIVQIDLT